MCPGGTLSEFVQRVEVSCSDCAHAQSDLACYPTYEERVTRHVDVERLARCTAIRRAVRDKGDVVHLDFEGEEGVTAELEARLVEKDGDVHLELRERHQHHLEGVTEAYHDIVRRLRAGLPKATTATRRGAASEVRTRVERRGVRVLVVEDNNLLRRALIARLALEGFDVDSAAGGVEAIEAVGLEPAAIVISDVRLPGMGGVELRAWFREHQPSTRVLLCSGHDVAELARLGIRRDDPDFLAKPFDPNELVARVIDLAEMRLAETDAGGA